MASCLPAAPSSTRAGFVGQQRLDRGRQGFGVAGRDGNRRLRCHHVAVAGDVGRDDGRRARERAGEHHAEALAAERRGDQSLRRRELGRQGLLGEEAEHVDAVVRDAEARQQQPHGERVGAGDPQARAGPAPDLRPRAQQDLEALPRLLAAGEDDAVLAPTRLDAGRDEHAVRNDLVVAGEPPLRRLASLLGDRDPPVEPLLEEPPHRRGQAHPAEIAARMMRAHHRPVEERERRDAGRRRHRLVQVEDVEALPREHAPDPEDRPRTEDDVRQ